MIHYHGTPCGGQREQVARFLKGRHALIPWVRPEDLATAAAVCQSFCLDNGAFSAWNQGTPITDWSGYYDWVQEWERHPGFDFAIIPDVIDGTEADNDDLLMESKSQRGFSNGVPVWHLHESLDRLERLCWQHQRVALGSSGQWPTPGTESWWLRMGEAMTAACDGQGRPRAKLHGLRMLDPSIFERLPLASADSTNAVQNSSNYSRYGTYKPPNASTRMAIIAERIENSQSAACWQSSDEQKTLFELESA